MEDSIARRMARKHAPRHVYHGSDELRDPLNVLAIPALPASKITSGRFPLARMPRGTSGYVLTAKGPYIDPVYLPSGVLERPITPPITAVEIDNNAVELNKLSAEVMGLLLGALQTTGGTMTGDLMIMKYQPTIALRFNGGIIPQGQFRIEDNTGSTLGALVATEADVTVVGKLASISLSGIDGNVYFNIESGKAVNPSSVNANDLGASDLDWRAIYVRKVASGGANLELDALAYVKSLRPFLLPGAPSADLEAATKKYVDDSIVPPYTSTEILKMAHLNYRGIYWFCNHWGALHILDHTGYGYSVTPIASWRFKLYVTAEANNWGWAEKLYGGTLPLNGGMSRNLATWDKKRTFEALVDICDYDEQIIHLGCGHIDDPTVWGNISEHIGFVIINDKIYGTAAGGEDESRLLLEEDIPICARRLRCELTPGVSCKFWVNDVYKGAIPSNLPTGNTNAYKLLGASLCTTNDVEKEFRLLDVRVLQEE